MTEKDDGKIRLKREVGLTSAIMLIVGAIVGSGIYISPKGILEHAETGGYAMVLWVLSGMVATMGALCYAEVGILVPKSGGEYPIIYDAYGGIPGFLFAWTCTTVIRPSSLAIFTSAFSKYALSIADGSSPTAEKFLAIAAIWLVCFINCYSMKLTQEITKVFGYIKLSSLACIILLGIYGLATGVGDLSVFSPENTIKSADAPFFPSFSHIGLGLYHGLWSYDGWNQLNYVIEEIQNPEENLLKAILISLLVISGFYLFVNVFYISILGTEAILASEAVATEYAAKILPQVSFIIPIMVACSCLGAALVQGMTAARIPFCAARNGQMPTFLAMVNIHCLTPSPAVMLNGALATLMVLPADLNSLINYFSFCMWIFHTATCAAVIIFRYKLPEKIYPRSFKVPFFIPIVICIIGTYLVLVPFIQEFQKLVGGSDESFDLGYIFVFVWILVGLAIFMALEKANSIRLKNAVKQFTKKLQILFQVVPTD